MNINKIFNRERILILILVFFITGFWDIILRALSEGKIKFFGIENMKWVTVLKKYFEKHTVLSAALIAGFVGVIAYIVIILAISYLKISNVFLVLVITFIISGLIGFPMRWSGLFPILYEHYYKPLGITYSFITDGMSGVVVLITLAFLGLIRDKLNNI